MKYRMKYRLKDRELQKKLDDLTDGDFSKRLSAEGERMEIMTNCGRHCVLWFGKARRFALYVDKDTLDIEPPKYNPHVWNRWPDVTPPQDIPMKVKKVSPSGTEEWCCRVWVEDLGAGFPSGDAWCLVYEGKSDECDYDSWEEGFTFFFKPWDEPDDECKVEHEKDMHPDAIAARRYMGEEDEE